MPSNSRNQQSQLLTFQDFSAGIVQRINTLGALENSPAQLGAASITNTYRCIALPGGGLGPLPRRVSSLSQTDLTMAAIPNGVTASVSGAMIFGPMYQASSTSVRYPPFATTAKPFELHLAYEYSSGGTQNYAWNKYPYYSSYPAFAIKSVSFPASGKYGTTWFSSERMNHTTPTGTGLPVIVGSWSTPADPLIANTDFCFVYPDPTSFATFQADFPYDMGTDFLGPGMGHQNRHLTFFRISSPHGQAGLDQVPTNEHLFFTQTNDYIVYDVAGVISPTIFGPENPTGYGAWGSLTASDLVVIKHDGGAFLIQGAITVPTVRSFPSVVGTGGVEVLGASSPYGFIYGSKNDGVYSWQGGDSSVKLSPQLEDGFWENSSILNYMFGGGFYSWGEYLLAPNNFLFNGTGWWRLDDPSYTKYMMYDKDPINNTLYAIRPTFTSADPIVAGGYSKTLPATNFSWQSQPFGANNRRRQRIQGVYVTAAGTGTVTITFTSDEGGGSVINQPNTITLTSSTPTRKLYPCNIFGTEVTMRIVSDGTNAAPTIYQIDLDMSEAGHVDNL